MTSRDKVKEIPSDFLSPESVEAIPEEQQTLVCETRSADEILMAAAVSKAECSLRIVGGSTPRGHLVRPKKSDDIRFQSEEPVNAKPGTRILVSFWVFNEFYVFRSIITGQENEALVIETPTAVHRIHRRRLDRTQLQTSDRFSVSVREMNGRRHVSGTVTDLSPVGFGIEVSLDNHRTVDRLGGLDRDLVLVADIPGNPARNSTPAKVAHWKAVPESSVAQLGVACATPLAVGDEPALEDFLLERRYPDVFRARTDDDYEKIWKMLFGLEKTVHVDASRKDSSIVTWKKTSWSPQPLHRIYLLRNPEDPSKTQGTLSVSRFYSRTWLIHQLVVDGARGRVLSHQLYGRTVDFLRQTNEVKYMIGTWPKGARVFDRYYVDFIRDYPYPSHNFLEASLLLEFPVREALRELVAISPTEEVGTSPFSYSQQGEVLAFLRSKYPPIFLDALDIEEYRMLLEDAEDYYSRVALPRKREIVLAHSRDGELAGFALVEFGCPNQNIFSLFDNFRIFVTTPDSTMADDVRRKLLRATMKVYLAAGISNAVTWTTDSGMEKVVTCCRRELPEAYFWIAACCVGKPFMRHLDRLHGRISTLRAARRERIKEVLPHSQDDLDREFRHAQL